ncbi:neuron navigator 3 [Lampris incognitus]|uniref:neuron navigator 3 n=1 Tax=Lampris incognitus TaxID=2546036 RepID=UPI0024B5AB42|nr:neuron navigator 3 [Lampris incognitus]
MPVVGVASKLRQPSAVGSKPVHTALPIPNPNRTAAVPPGYAGRAADTGPPLSCQLSIKSEYQQERRTPEGKTRAETEENKICKIYTDWANHYLAKSGCQRLIKDLSQDVADGVLLAEIIQIIANEKVEDINGSPRSQTQMIENVDACLSFLSARGVNVQGLSAEEIRNGNLKSILGLFFILSRYKQQQQQQQQYYQSLVELSQQTSTSSSSSSSSSSSAHKTQDMQSRSIIRLSDSEVGFIAPENTFPLLQSPMAVWHSACTAASQQEGHGFKSHLGRVLALAHPHGAASSAAPSENWRAAGTSSRRGEQRGALRQLASSGHVLTARRAARRPQTTDEQRGALRKLASSGHVPTARRAAGRPQKSGEQRARPHGMASSAAPSDNWRAAGTSPRHGEQRGALRKVASSGHVLTARRAAGRPQTTGEQRAVRDQEYSWLPVHQKSVRGIPVPGGMNGTGIGGSVPTSLSGQQLASAIPSPTASKSWRSKSMNLKHSATSSMLASPTHSPSPTPPPTQASDRLRPPAGEGPKAGSGAGSVPPQRSMLEKFRLINPRSASRTSPSMAEMALQEEDDLSEYGEDGLTPVGPACTSTTASRHASPAKTPGPGLTGPGKTPPSSSSSSSVSSSKAATSGSKSASPPKDREEGKGKSGRTPKASSPHKEEREAAADQSKKSSKIASLIPKGGKSSSGKKESSAPPASSGIPKPGLKAPSTPTTAKSQNQNQVALNSSGNLRGGDGEKAKLVKGSQGGSFYMQRSLGGLEGRRTSITSSSSTSALSGSTGGMVGGGGGGVLGGNGVVQLPQQQQHNHPNTATVAPFMYRTFSENDCTMVAPADPCLSPTKGELVYSKTAKQCLEELSGSDPETRRMRTVKNIADLRQNLEETMSSLRGTQISHSTLETTFDTTVTTEVNGRSLPGLATRSSPMAWRLGQSQTPRLQAGDAPSIPSGGYAAPRSTGTMAATANAAGRYSGHPESSRYITEGGLHLYARNASRTSDLPSSRDMSQRAGKEMQGDIDSWDDSSSVSSGLSDTLDNISTDDLNTPAYAVAGSSSSRKNKGAQTQRGSRSRHAEQEVGSSWAGAEDLKKVDEELDANMDPTSRWKHSSSSSSQPQGQYEDPGQKASQTGSWRRGATAQVGITPPRTKSSTASLKTPGKTDDAKASEKGKAPSKSSASIQRSPSDAGKSSGDEGKKPPSGIARPPTAGSFGYKKIPGPTGTLITSSGASLTSGSATLGKVPKSSAALGKGPGLSGVRKTSLDGSQPQDDGILLGCGGSKVPLQYRSLPRPAKSSSGAAAGRSGHRSSSSSIDSNVSGKSVGGAATPAGAKRREAGKVGSDRSSPITVNQTDKEKGAVSDQDPAVGVLSTSPKSSPTSCSAGQSGLRQPGSKYPDIASPTFRRLFGTKASSKASSPGTPDSGKCPSALGSPHGTLARQASLDSPSSGTGSLGSASCMSGGSSPLYGKTPDLCTDSPASSPASGLSLPSNARPWPACSSSAGSKDTLSCQSMMSLHTSSESIDLPLGHHGPKVTRTGSVKSTLSEGMTLDRNTLPKKGLRYQASNRQTSHDEGKEWLRSHSTGGLQDTGSHSPLSPSGASCTAAGKYHYSNLLSPTNISQYNLPPGSASMSRSNSIPAQDSFELYGEGHPLGGSATSLEDRPRAISRSGSFRDSTDEVHGSSLSLVSSTSSLYSATEEKAHSEGQTVQNSTQIRKLRRELDASQEKVATLTSQLSANAHLVAAFEKSLGNMTCRLQSLTMTAEQKESELAELRETIETLKTQNTDAQEAIQEALNGPPHLHKDLRIRRQHSSESMSSINSAASHSSMGSLGKDAEDKKKKKKSWVADSIPAQLRSSFKQAFSKKKTKSQSAHDETEEMSDSLPSSPKLQHANRQGSIPTLRTSPSTTELCECTEAEAEIILQLKNELREKELKLTDIRLEALSSAHHLDQIREAMNRMQNEIEILKAENDRLKSSGNATPTATPTPIKSARPPSETSSTSSSSSRQSLGLSLNNLNITDTIMSDILLDDGYEGNLRKEGRSVRIVVTINSGSNQTKGKQKQDYLIGSIGVSGKTKWDVLDGVIRRLFKEYVFRVDPMTSLGLNSDSIVCYRMGEVVRAHASEVPELLPCGYLVGDSNVIKVHLKGVKENSIDGLVFDTLIPKPIIQRYLNLLMEHRRIILSGPSGTGKSFLAAKLAEYIVLKMGREVTEHNVASFNVDQKSSKDLRQYLSSLAEQCNSEETETELPTVVILDNLHHIGSLSDIFNGFLNCKYHKCPYVIGTMNQGVSSSPNLELHHNFRWVLCANHTEPIKGFLGRFLRRKLIETEIDKNMRSNDLIKIIDWIPKTWQHLNGFLEAHSSSDVTIGPRLFLSCPMDAEGSRVWFTDLWNYSLVPYLLEAVREGLQLYGKRAAWEDPSKWVMDTYPWSAASLQQEGQSLLQLRPEDVGYDGYCSSKEGTSSKQVSQSDTEGDPLMNMLLRLQEAANYSSPQSCDSDSTSHHDDQLDSSLESAL